MFIHCRSFPVELLGSLMYTIISAAYKDTLTSFQCVPSLISFSCLIALAKTQVPYWMGMERVRNLALFLILAELLWVFLHLSWCWLWACCKLPLLYWSIPCISNLSRTFIMKGYWILSKAFSASNKMIMWVLLFALCGGLHLLIYICCTIFASLGWSLLDHGGWSFWCVLWFIFSKNFIEYFCNSVYKEIGL